MWQGELPFWGFFFFFCSKKKEGKKCQMNKDDKKLYIEMAIYNISNSNNNSFKRTTTKSDQD